MSIKRPIAIVDLFSGPGGLGEGFSAVRDGHGNRRYQIGISVEKEASAHKTLRLRAFLRQFQDLPAEYYLWINGQGPEPDWPALYPREWRAAEHEARCLELGTPEAAHVLESRIKEIKDENGGHTLLIGGPPCQAYSLVGRARNSGNQSYRPELDHRNFLYDEYVKVLTALAPAAFVMENVKGMLSAAVSGNAIFQRVMEDLRSAGGHNNYELFALSSAKSDAPPIPKDFIVRAENHGVPQTRHRVIIVGLRRDIVDALPDNLRPRLKFREEPVSAEMVLGSMPRMRSGLSRGDDPQSWITTMADAINLVDKAIDELDRHKIEAFREQLRAVEAEIDEIALQGRIGNGGVPLQANCPEDLLHWLIDPAVVSLPQNETRGHMPSDLARYLFAACYGKVFLVSPKAADFPASLAPKHRNWESGKFNDRFRVQLAERPSSTVTSHIAKDGHYFIHPDPSQCRSLTVREGARLQTFPDNYVFLGNRTQQYVQVGNAVPPFLAWQIAKSLLPIFDFIDEDTMGHLSLQQATLA